MSACTAWPRRRFTALWINPIRCEKRLLARSNELDRGGFHAQVKVTRETTLLFYNIEGRREPLRSRNGKFTAGNSTFSVEELHAAIDRAPEFFTANALLRPVVQDTLFPTAAYIGGPAEIAYMAQAQVAYEKILGRMPAILPRSSFTIVEPPIAAISREIRPLDSRGSGRSAAASRENGGKSACLLSSAVGSKKTRLLCGIY